MLQDNSFKPISRLSSWDGRQDAIKRAKVVRHALKFLCSVLMGLTTQYVMMPAGIIRGALSRLGLIGVVVPEINALPQCMPSTSPFVVNSFQPPDRYIPDKTAKTLMNRLSLPMYSHSGRWSSECSSRRLHLATVQLAILCKLRPAF